APGRHGRCGAGARHLVGGRFPAFGGTRDAAPLPPVRTPRLRRVQHVRHRDLHLRTLSTTLPRRARTIPAAKERDMSETAPEIRKGLAGVVADTTAISKVNPETNSLLYRGYPVQELAERCSFEEVAWLLWHG